MASVGPSSTSDGGGGQLVENEDAVTSTSAKNVDDAFVTILTCCKCKETAQGRSSKLLTCLHTVCGPCYISYTKDGEFECATCLVRSNVASIVENFIAYGLDASSKQVLRCTSDPCPDNGIAKFRCAQCDDSLCAKCKEAHQRVKVTKDHPLTPINDGRSVSIVSSTCRKHPQEELTLYCNKCNVLTCRDCQLSQEHSGHNDEYSNFNDAVREQTTRLFTFSSNAELKAGELSTHCRNVNDRLDLVESMRKQFKREVKNAAQTLFTTLRRRVELLGATIDETCNQRRQQYLTIKSPLERTVKLAKQSSVFSQAAASHPDKYAVLHSMKYIHAQLGIVNDIRKSYNINDIQTPNQPMRLNLQTEELARQISNFGMFTCEPNTAPIVRTDAPNGNANASAMFQAVWDSPMQHPSPRLQQMLHQRVSAPVLHHMAMQAPQLQQQHRQPAVVPRPPPPALPPPPPDYATFRQWQPQGPIRVVTTGPGPPNAYVGYSHPNRNYLLRAVQQGQARPMCAYAAGPQQAAVSNNRRISSPAMPASPSGVSSTSITPPQIIQQMPYANDQRMVSPTCSSLSPRLPPPPPLVSAIQEFNTPAASMVSPQRQTACQVSAVSLQHLMNMTPPGTVPIQQRSPTFPGLPRLTPAPTLDRQQQPTPVVQQNVAAACAVLAGQSPTIAVSSVAETSPTTAPSLPAPTANCNPGRSADATSTVASSSPTLSPASAAPSGSTVELITISPNSVEEKRIRVCSSGLLDTTELKQPKENTTEPNGQQVSAFTESNGAIEDNQQPAASTDNVNPTANGNDTSPAHVEESARTTGPVANVTSTTTEGESAGSSVNKTPLRRMARKSITLRQIAALEALATSPSPISPPRVQSQQPDTVTASNTGNMDIGEDTGVNCRNGPNSLNTPKPDDASNAQNDSNVSTSATNNKESDVDRTWDDYCAVCNNGGTLVCCDADDCRRVFHHDHHVPQLTDTPQEHWQCTFCIDLEQFKTEQDDVSREKRETMTQYELKICQRILLHLYTHCESAAFHEPVDETYGEYFEIIKKPMDFSIIRNRLDPSAERSYRHVRHFIRDLNQIFINCDVFNTAGRDSQLRGAGVVVGREYLELVQRYFPDLSSMVKLNGQSLKRRNTNAPCSGSEFRRRRVVLEENESA